MAKEAQDELELNKLSLDLPPLNSIEMGLLDTIGYTGITFSPKTTTCDGDETNTKTVLLDNYGMFTLDFVVHPQNTTLWDLTNKQIRKKWPKKKDKPVGTVERASHDGTKTSTWHIERWFINRIHIGSFDKGDGADGIPMRIVATIRPEKFVMAGA